MDAKKALFSTILANKKLVSGIYILILVAAFFKIYTYIFDEKVSLVGDNASYYILGTSIANGDGYTNIQHAAKEAHYHYPPGYPVIIAAVTTLVSENVNTVKWCNGILLLSAIIVLFFIIKTLANNSHIAFISCLLTLLNLHILEYATIMMSEIPFLFFSLLSIGLFFKIDFRKPVFKNGIFLLFLLCISFSFYIRSVGLALFVSVTAFLFLKKHWRYAVTFISGFVLLYLPWFIRNASFKGNTYVSQLSLKNPYQPELGQIGFWDIGERIFVNIERYLTKEIPSGIISTKDIIYQDASFSLSELGVGFLIIIGVIFGIFRLKKYRMFIALYCLAFFSLLLLWPSVWYGTRFILPLVPILIFLLVFGIAEFITISAQIVASKQTKWIVSAVLVLIFGSWTILYGQASISKLKTQAEGIYTNNYQNYFAIAAWMHKNTSPTTVTSVRKEGLFYLFSKGNVINYKKTVDKEAQIAYLKSKNVDYVVVEQLGYSSTSKYLVPAIDRYPNKFKIIKEFKNPNTYLMQFLPELGYTGAWKNDKRNGQGTYVWEDGQKYVGQWKDNIRHGKGTVYFKNGESLTGTWENGKLEGKVIKKSKDGNVLEISMYKNNAKVAVVDETN